MHPNAKFRETDRAFHEALIDQIGFGMIFCETPDGPRVAHTPVLSNGEGQIRFHLSRGNALTRHLPGRRALIVVNGPEAYVSARWYADPDQVPTWNYVAAEMEGAVSEMDSDGLISLLETISARHEGRIAKGVPWTMDKLSDRHREGLLRAITGFEMEVEIWRETAKLSQNKSAQVREPLIAGLEQQGDAAMAQLMRSQGE